MPARQQLINDHGFMGNLIYESYHMETPMKVEIKKEVTDSEYNECSSDICPHCSNRFYIMANGWDVPQGYECPHCESLVLCPTIREARKVAKQQREASAIKRPYAIVVTRAGSGSLWGVIFGDYSYDVALQECLDMVEDGSYHQKNIRIFQLDDDKQEVIDAHVSALNNIQGIGR